VRFACLLLGHRPIVEVCREIRGGRAIDLPVGFRCSRCGDVLRS
jgi:hypothetical protein